MAGRQRRMTALLGRGGGGPSPGPLLCYAAHQVSNRDAPSSQAVVHHGHSGCFLWSSPTLRRALGDEPTTAHHGHGGCLLWVSPISCRTPGEQFEMPMHLRQWSTMGTVGTSFGPSRMLCRAPGAEPHLLSTQLMGPRLWYLLDIFCSRKL